ncbi:hypothetical protein GCM10009749_12470 [Agromyces neolithicus]|uniref:HTH tetR-type domain-containing protein n=1 Tax=Agromyces neolithicus TaxID=269420 RepID=A0ABN2M1B0_9MICO
MRQIQREAGRAHIADVASVLFIEGGYANTSVKSVAAAAKVAEATVFNLFDTKATLLREALARRVMEVVGGWSESLAEMERRDDPGDVIDLFNRFDEQVAPRALGVVRVFLEAAAVDADVAEAWRISEETRCEIQQQILDVLERGGWLRTDRTRDQMARDLWLTASPELYLKARNSELDDETYWAWRAATLKALLLAPS